jgi:prevent-host-death family protein
MIVVTHRTSREKGGPNEPAIWTITEAKARLSELIERAGSQGPQTIMRNGRIAAVVVSPVEWEGVTRRPENVAEFFAASPLPGAELARERRTDGPRQLAL